MLDDGLPLTTADVDLLALDDGSALGIADFSVSSFRARLVGGVALVSVARFVNRLADFIRDCLVARFVLGLADGIALVAVARSSERHLYGVLLTSKRGFVNRLVNNVTNGTVARLVNGPADLVALFTESRLVDVSSALDWLLLADGVVDRTVFRHCALVVDDVLDSAVAGVAGSLSGGEFTTWGARGGLAAVEAVGTAVASLRRLSAPRHQQPGEDDHRHCRFHLSIPRSTFLSLYRLKWPIRDPALPALPDRRKSVKLERGKREKPPPPFVRHEAFPA